jgi:hypothetical protein
MTNTEIIESSYFDLKKYRWEFIYDSYGNILTEKRYKKRLGKFKKRTNDLLNYIYTYY